MGNEETKQASSSQASDPAGTLAAPPAPRLVPQGTMLGTPTHVGMPSLPATNQDTVPDAATLLRAVRRHWFLIAFLGLLVGGGVAAGIWMAVPGKYVATAIVRVHSTPPRLVYDSKEIGTGGNFGMYMRTQQQLMRLSTVLNRALDGLKPASRQRLPEEMPPISPGTLSFVNQQQDPVSSLNGQLSVKASARSEFMQIQVEHDDPLAARDLANVVVDAYMSQVNLENEQVTDRQKQLEALAAEQRRVAEANVDRLKAEVVAAGSTDGRSLNAEQQLLIDNMGILSKEAMKIYLQILQTTVDLSIARQRQAEAMNWMQQTSEQGDSSPEDAESPVAADIALGLTGADPDTASVPGSEPASQGDATEMEGSMEDGASPEPEKGIAAPNIPRLINSALEQHPLIRPLQQEVQANKLKVQSIDERAARSDDPILVAARARLRAAEIKLEERKRDLRSIVQRKVQDAYVGQFNAEVRRLTALLHELEQQRAALLENYQVKRKDVAKVGELSFELEMARKVVARDEELLDRIENLKQSLEIESQAPARIEVIEWAAAPTGLNNTRRTKLAAFGGMGGFAAVAFLIGFIEVRRKRIMVPDDVARRVGVAVVGTVPELPLRARRTSRGMLADAAGPWYRVFQESVDGLRAQLMYANPDRPLRTIMVTSAVSGEGKTELATHLAVSLARAGQRTLLIDTDLRRPMLHELFDAAPGPGIADVVAGSVTTEAAVIQTPFLGLDLLVAGAPAPDPTKLLSDERFGEVIAQLRQDYRFVILDLPPVLPFSDALLVGQHVDGALFSVLRDVSQSHHLRSASERLRRVGVSILGAVLGGMIYDDFMYEHYRRSDEEAARHE